MSKQINTIETKPIEEVNNTNMDSDGRNLAFAFEQLYVTEKQDSTPNVNTAGKLEILVTTDIEIYCNKDKSNKNIISPICVIEEANKSFHSYDNKKNNNSKKEDFVLEFNVHSDLKRSLTQGQVNRISIYSVIHEINKEASSMASNDFSVSEETCSNSSLDVPPSSAVIDEEQWLLAAISSRSKEEMKYRPCPASFAESIGEEENALTGKGRKDAVTGMTPNPLSVLSNSRTQLWKPSRSWWEARSGRNPWIEPKSHNKRWRYLWPMIHYHKFLARCIKKLKRNGVDVKTSFSPVSVFLRDEVCAVSEHLGSISKFSAEEWLDVLSHYDGWASTEQHDEENLRALVSTLRLKNLGEPSDTESGLLRDQIDLQFLRTMAHARQTGDENNRPKEKNKVNKYATHPYAYNVHSKAPNKDYHLNNIHHAPNHFVPPPVSNIPMYPPHGGILEHQEPFFHDVYHQPPMQPHYGSHYLPPHVPYHNPYYHPESYIPPQQQVHHSHQNENEFYSIGSPSYNNSHGVNHSPYDPNSPYCESPYWLNALVNDHDTSNSHAEHNAHSPGDQLGIQCAKPLIMRPPSHYYTSQHNVPPSPATQFYNTLSFSPYSNSQNQLKSSKAPSESNVYTEHNGKQTPLRKLPTSVEVESETD